MPINDEAVHDYLTIREVAAISRFSERTIWNLIIRGTLPAVRRPGGLKATRIRRSDFEAMMTSTSTRRRAVAV